MNKAMYVTVALICKYLSDEELVKLNNMAQADFSPNDELFKQIEHPNRIHNEIKHALSGIVIRRLK